MDRDREREKNWVLLYVSVYVCVFVSVCVCVSNKEREERDKSKREKEGGQGQKKLRHHLFPPFSSDSKTVSKTDKFPFFVELSVKTKQQIIFSLSLSTYLFPWTLLLSSRLHL